MAFGPQHIGTTMGTQSNFDLSGASLQWRQELVRQGITPVEANELESHLRDAMADLRPRGLSEEEAFWIARHRLGAVADLAEQFAKADPARVWKDRIFWSAALALVGVLGMRLSVFFWNWLANLLLQVGVPGGWHYFLAQIPMVLPVAVVALLLAHGCLQPFCQWVARLFGSQLRFSKVSAVLCLGFLGVLGIELWQLTNWRDQVGGIAGHLNFWGTLLANAAWPATLVILMFSVARGRETSTA